MTFRKRSTWGWLVAVALLVTGSAMAGAKIGVGKSGDVHDSSGAKIGSFETVLDGSSNPQEQFNFDEDDDNDVDSIWGWSDWSDAYWKQWDHDYSFDLVAGMADGQLIYYWTLWEIDPFGPGTVIATGTLRNIS